MLFEHLYLCFVLVGLLGLGGSVVMKLLATMPHQQYLSVYTDNFFTSLNHLHQQKKWGFNATGAIPSNRLQKCSLLDADKKKTRGQYDFRSDATSGLIVVQWNDNSIVSVEKDATAKCRT